MISTRHLAEAAKNKELREVPARRAESNRQWLSRVKATRGLLLLGGNSLAHFRIRVAQSHMRSDMLPSFWSLAGILDGPQNFYSVPLDLWGEASEVPRSNGVQRCRIQDYDDPKHFPNIALLNFPGTSDNLRMKIRQLQSQRGIIDVPSLMLSWLGFVWGAGSRGNPLLESIGLPSAAFVEAVYGIDRVDLTPGLSSASSCPEAVWQSAKWWGQYYEKTAAGESAEGASAKVPTGHYTIRQREAAAVEHRSRRRGR